MATKTVSSSNDRLVILSAVLWVAIYLGSLLLIKKVELTDTVKVILAFAPLLPFIFFFTAYIRVNKIDELHWQVQLRAAAIAFFLTLLLLMTLGLLALVIPLSDSDFSLRHIWQYCIFFYFIGLAYTWRKYKA